MIAAEAIAVDDTATLLFEFTTEIQSVYVQNHSGSANAIELIGADGSFGDGPELIAGEGIALSGVAGEAIYAICDTAGTASVRVLKQGI